MPKLSEHVGSNFVKLLYLGDSGVGKTGSLVSLVKAGYKLRVLDMDNGLNILVSLIKKECPDLINNVEYETRRDKYKSTSLGPVVDGVPKAFNQAMGLMDKWSDGTVPQNWGPEYIFVVDTFSGLGQAALAWATSMNSGAKDPRQWFNTAQRALEQVLSLLTNEAFKAHVIICAHVQIQEGPDGAPAGYANAIGKALGPMIPTYLNTMILATKQGEGTNVKRSIVTLPTSLLALKNPVPFSMPGKLPLETGLSTIFETLIKGTN